MTRYVIYQIKNSSNGRVYIGSSKNFPVRRRQHLRMLRNNEHHCPPLQKAFIKYGESNFEISVLEELESTELMLLKENEYLSRTDLDLYNLWLSATDASGDKNSNYKTGKSMHLPCVKCGKTRKTVGEGYCSPCYFAQRDISGDKNPFYGKTHSDEYKKQQSELRKGLKSESPQCVKVEVDGVVYDSMGEASRSLGCVVATVYNRCNSDKFPNYKKV